MDVNILFAAWRKPGDDCDSCLTFHFSAKEIKTSSRSKFVKRVVRKTPSITSPATAGRSGGGGGKSVPPIMRQSAALDKAEAAKKAANAAAIAAKAKVDDSGGIFFDMDLR